jgi:hypothetical protein
VFHVIVSEGWGVSMLGLMVEIVLGKISCTDVNLFPVESEMFGNRHLLFLRMGAISR